VVFLALTREAALEAIALAKAGGHHVWVGTDVLSQAEHSAQVDKGVKLTRFSFALSADSDTVDDAVATIREHHPSESIWVQRAELAK
jgi:hypothetical protein